MRIISSVHGEYVIRRGEHSDFEIISRQGGTVQVSAVELHDEQAAAEFVRALNAAFTDAGKLAGKPKFKPAKVPRVVNGWPGIETK